jgi:hypothetical protein
MKFIHRRFREGPEGLYFSPIPLEVGLTGIKNKENALEKKSAFLQKTGRMFFIDLQDHESPNEKGRSSLCPGDSKITVFVFRGFACFVVSVETCNSARIFRKSF